MTKLYDYRLFISHAWKYGDDYKSEIQELISAKIRPSQITIVLSGMYAAHSDWMKYEIDESVRMGKPILAVLPWGQQRVPSYITMHADKIVGWNTNSIVSAIRSLIK